MDQCCFLKWRWVGIMLENHLDLVFSQWRTVLKSPFSCFRPKTQNFRSSFKLLWPIGFRKKVFKSFQMTMLANTHRKIMILINFRDFDFLSFWCKTRIFRSTSEALIWRFFMCDIFFLDTSRVICSTHQISNLECVWSLLNISISIRSNF